MVSITSTASTLMPTPPPSQLGLLVDYVMAGSAICGAIGSATALGVDFIRRRVRAKAAEYAASNAFELLREDLTNNHDDFQGFLKEYRGDRARSQENHLELCQRVARLEAKIHD